MIVLGRCAGCGRRLGDQTASTVERLLTAPPRSAWDRDDRAEDLTCLSLLFLEACGTHWQTSAWGLDKAHTAAASLDLLSPHFPRVDDAFVRQVETQLTVATSPPWAIADAACLRLALAEALFDCALSDDRPLRDLQSLDASVTAAAHSV